MKFIDLTLSVHAGVLLCVIILAVVIGAIFGIWALNKINQYADKRDEEETAHLRGDIHLPENYKEEMTDWRDLATDLQQVPQPIRMQEARAIYVNEMEKMNSRRLTINGELHEVSAFRENKDDLSRWYQTEIDNFVDFTDQLNRIP